jgi:poly(hydroxyalkanoate) granule-associated protein
MVKKTTRAAGDKAQPPAGLLDSQLAQSVKESAQQIWLAGMGAFAKAQEGRLKVFEALIKEGTSLQRKTQRSAEEKIGEVTDRMSAMAGDAAARAGQHWDKLESIFEQRTAKAMNKLGVPTAKDVDALIKRVDELAAAVAKLSKTAAPARTTAKAPAKRAAPPAKKTPRAAARKAAR